MCIFLVNVDMPMGDNMVFPKSVRSTWVVNVNISVFLQRPYGLEPALSLSLLVKKLRGSAECKL